MEQPVDVSFIKTEFKEEPEDEEYEEKYKIESCETEYLKQEQNECKEETQKELGATEIDIGPVQLESNFTVDVIKVECEESQFAEQSTGNDVGQRTKSNNRRDIVRALHQRLLRLDDAMPAHSKNSNGLGKIPSKPAQISHKNLQHSNRDVNPQNTLPISSAERMRDLRQRLMNLDKPRRETKETSDNPIKNNGQVKREMERRLMILDNINRSAKKDRKNKILLAKNLPKSRVTQSTNGQDKLVILDNINRTTKHKQNMAREPPKSSAQRMREMRQRRQELNNASKSTEPAKMNSRPPTPPELSVKRMRDFRQRILQLDKPKSSTKLNK